MILSGDIAFDQHVVADLVGHGVGGEYLLLAGQVDRDPFALIAVLRLDDDGNAVLDADLAGSDPGILGIMDGTAGRNGYAG